LTLRIQQRPAYWRVQRQSNELAASACLPSAAPASISWLDQRARLRNPPDPCSPPSATDGRPTPPLASAYLPATACCPRSAIRFGGHRDRAEAHKRTPWRLAAEWERSTALVGTEIAVRRSPCSDKTPTAPVSSLYTHFSLAGANTGVPARWRSGDQSVVSPEVIQN